MSSPRPIFDRNARRVHRDRAGGDARLDFERHVSALLLDRLDTVRRSFGEALVINTGMGLLADDLRARAITVIETDYGPRTALTRGAICVDEDRLAISPASVDLVLAPHGFDTIDDLPGALILARRALRPGGLFLASFPGAPTLSQLRRIVAAADGEATVARLHPLVDVRAGGDLLMRAGLVLPVADVETQSVSYRSFGHLIGDLRAYGGTNVLVERHAVGRNWQTRARAEFARLADDHGRVVETMSLIVLTGWAPALLA